MMSSLKEQEEAADKLNSPLVGWALMIVLIGIIPWAIYCTNTLVPALGITRMKIGALIALIVLPPALILGLVFKINSARKDAAGPSSTAAADAARARRNSGGNR